MRLQNLVTTWAALGLRRQLIAVGAALAMFAAILGLAGSATKPDMALLYAGLDRVAAGDVVAALENQDVVYEIDGDAIFVDSARRDELRMTLAAEGLPANAGGGYELLDNLSGFGTTSQMFDAAYWRAKEGEIARTIVSNPRIRSARVHIAQGATQPFKPDGEPTASVTVTTADGGLNAAQAKAIRHLVAAAVLNLRPENVAVIDSVGGLVPNDGEGPVPGPAAASRAEEIRRNVERLLSAHVGPGGAVVEVNVDLVTEQETVSERHVLPDERVAISTETGEVSESSEGASGGAVTVASNLPEEGGAGGNNQKSQSSDTTERTNFDVSETRREVVRLPGDIRRLTVAVLVDGVETVAEDGTVTRSPRSEEDLATLRELVASAVGLNEERGDVLTLKSLDFLPPVSQGTLAEAGFLSAFGPINLMQVIQIAVLALVTVILGLFVVRPILASGRAGAAAALTAAEEPLALPDLSDGANFPVLNGVIDFDSLEDGSSGTDGSDPMERLKKLIEERQAESIEILRGWMEKGDGEEAA